MESASANGQNYPNNKPDTIIRDNEKGTCILTDVIIPVDRKVIKKLINVSENILKCRDLTIEIQRMWNVKNKSDTTNNKGDWYHLKITQTLPEQHIGKVRN